MNQEHSIVEFKEIQPNNDGKVDSLALYDFLQIKSPHSQWFKRVIDDYGFVEGQDFFTKMLRSSGGRKQQAYDITVGMAKEACMTARGDIGRKVRRYYLELEKHIVAPKSITTGEETARFFNNLLDEVSKYSPTSRITIGAQISEKVFGIKLPYHALPLVTEARKSATDIGKELDLSANMIGRIANKLNLKVEPFVEWRMSVSQYTNKEVSIAYYNLDAQKQIKEYVKINFNEQQTTTK